jgi:hypothetical protein
MAPLFSPPSAMGKNGRREERKMRTDATNAYTASVYSKNVPFVFKLISHSGSTQTPSFQKQYRDEVTTLLKT